MSLDRSTAPLVFVYLGDVLPEYTAPSLRFARRDANRRVILLGTAESRPEVEGVGYHDVSAWYDSRKFEHFRQRSPLNPHFRDDFWFRTAERFFVLDQWAHREGIANFFHAELDNLIFTLAPVEDALSHQRTKLLFPADSAGRGFGSLVYCGGHEAIGALVTFMVEHADLGNEMLILGQFLRDKPQFAARLPSVETKFASPRRKEDVANVAKLDGLFDAAALGQWLFGIDPSNTSESVFTKRKNESSDVNLRGLRFHYRRKEHTLWIKRAGQVASPVFNLHVHSKIIGRLEISLRYFLWAARFPFSVVVVFRPGRVRHQMARAMLSKKHLRLTKSLAKLIPFFSFFLKSLAAARHSQLSRREQSELANL